MFHCDLQPAVAAFKAARLFCPHKVIDLHPDTSAVDSVAAFPLRDNGLIANLKAELPQYLASDAELG